jgi:type IV secretory pathway TrbF-like protein
LFKFGRKSKAADTLSAVRDMGNAPLTAYQQAENKFFEIYGSAKVESARWFIAAVSALFVIGLLGIAIWRMLPLKEVVPYSVVVNRDTGAVAQVVEAARFNPDDNVRSYFLTKWVEKARTLDPYLTQANLKEAYSFTRDKAIQEFTEYVDQEKPVQQLMQDRTLTRTVKFNAVNPGRESNIAFIRVIEETRSGTGSPTVKRFMFTIHYAITPAKTVEEMRQNPIGIYITHFVKSEEVGN